MKTSQKKICNILTAVATLIVPFGAIAHPGHGITAANHSLLHSEHTMVLAAIIAVVHGIRWLRRAKIDKDNKDDTE